MSVFENKPTRESFYWEGYCEYDNGKAYYEDCLFLKDEKLFPGLKWEDEPIEVKLIVVNPEDNWILFGENDSFMGK